MTAKETPETTKVVVDDMSPAQMERLKQALGACVPPIEVVDAPTDRGVRVMLLEQMAPNIPELLKQLEKGEVNPVQMYTGSFIQPLSTAELVTATSKDPVVGYVHSTSTADWDFDPNQKGRTKQRSKYMRQRGKRKRRSQ